MQHDGKGFDMTDPAAIRRYEIKKYPNRRFYDVSRSRHVTLSDLHELVRIGNEIFVTDSATGNDITNVVLAQIILEHDPPKLDLFPASLLHQAIQANEQMVRKFIDQYFSRAMDAFVKSRHQFDEYLKRIGVSAMTPMAPFDWVRMLFPQQGGNPFMSPSMSSPGASSAAGSASPGFDGQAPMHGFGPPPAPSDASSEMPDSYGRAGDSNDTLASQVVALRQELAALRSTVKRPSPKSTGRAKARKPRK
jgi:polyhydroxyalkanoate synthesis repressor PhaR